MMGFYEEVEFKFEGTSTLFSPKPPLLPFQENPPLARERLGARVARIRFVSGWLFWFCSGSEIGERGVTISGGQKRGKFMDLCDLYLLVGGDDAIHEQGGATGLGEGRGDLEWEFWLNEGTLLSKEDTILVPRLNQLKKFKEWSESYGSDVVLSAMNRKLMPWGCICRLWNFLDKH